MSRHTVTLFFALWLTFGWFFQGGGWNQNARFAEVRAIVEEGRLEIDDYLFYERTNADGGLRRLACQNGELIRDGERIALTWMPTDDARDPRLGTVTKRAPAEGQRTLPLKAYAASGDVGFSGKGHFHPNKPPGTSLLAVPVYAALYAAEKALGLSPDSPLVLRLNAWVITACTVGLFSALGCVVFFRLALALFPGATQAALLATVGLAMGSTFFPFATVFFDHNLTAALLISAFYAVRGGRATECPPTTLRIFVGGTLAGAAALTNYLAAVPGIALGVWALFASGIADWRRASAYLAGVMPCLIGLLVYNACAFGTPFALNTSFQNPAFVDPNGEAVLGMFEIPTRWELAGLTLYKLVALTLSPFRSPFVLAPIVLVAVVALRRLWPGDRLRWERRLIAGVCAFFFLVNVLFNGYHAGYSAGPRYLVPALPFLLLGAIPAFQRWKRVSRVALFVSCAFQGLLTATDAQCPLGVGGHAWSDLPGWQTQLRYNLVTQYAAPLYFTGRANAVIEMKLLEYTRDRRQQREREGLTGDRLEAAVQADVTTAQLAAERGDPQPFLMAAITGPVSVNPVGVWEHDFFAQTTPHSQEARCASLNLGELIWPESGWSIAPLLLLWAGVLRLLSPQMSRGD